MDNEIRKNAIRTLKHEIKKHFGTLQELLLIEADVELQNGFYIPKNSFGYINLTQVKEDKVNLLTTISDLEIICKSLELGKYNIVIHGSPDCPNVILDETLKSISSAGLSFSHHINEEGLNLKLK